MLVTHRQQLQKEGGQSPKEWENFFTIIREIPPHHWAARNNRCRPSSAMPLVYHSLIVSMKTPFEFFVGSPLATAAKGWLCGCERRCIEFFFNSYICTYVGPVQTVFLRGFLKCYWGTGIMIPVKKRHRKGKHSNPQDSCRNYQPSGGGGV